MPRIVIIAGERSGDQLGAGLIRALQSRYPELEFEGITGPDMEAAGCRSWGSYEQLAVMGLLEVLRHLPRLWLLHRRLRRRLLDDPPDLLIGIDSPDFTLRLEKIAREAGSKTVHYVCPSVWAWRSSRVQVLREACDLVLCLLPFEVGFLERHGVPARFVGHPMADEIPPDADAVAARTELGVPPGPVLALLPGSRMGEVSYLGPAFVGAAALLLRQMPGLQVIAAAATPAIEKAMRGYARSAGVSEQLRIVSGQARLVMAAADSVLLCSGTATLETMLVGRPMVVAYKVSALTAWLLRRSGVVSVRRFSLPNLLADEDLVPELIQEDATPELLAGAVLRQLTDIRVGEQLRARFRALAEPLRRSASEGAAAGVAGVLGLTESRH